MTHSRPARRTTRRIRVRRIRAAVLTVALAAAVAVLGQQSPASSPSAAPAPIDVLRGPRSAGKLDPALARALRQAAGAATGDGVAIEIRSGWRSRAHQAGLLAEAIAKYGSQAEAARWVATPDTSPHVSGDAVDVGPSGAGAWLARHGAVYGLCQIYANEPWHFELRPGAAERGCPPMYPDPTHDPRMR